MWQACGTSEGVNTKVVDDTMTHSTYLLDVSVGLGTAREENAT